MWGRGDDYYHDPRFAVHEETETERFRRLPKDMAGVRLSQDSSQGCSDLKALFLPTELLCLPMTISCRQIHVHRGAVPPGAPDGLLPDPDVHPQPAHRHPLMDLLLDQHGRRTRPRGPGHHHRAHHDHPELWLPGVPAQGKEGLLPESTEHLDR